MYIFTNLSTTQLGQRLLEVALKFLCPYFFPNFNLSKLWKTMNYAPFKVHIFGEGHKILRNIHLTFDYIQSKERWRFRKILWPSQNVWTLIIWLHKCLDLIMSYLVLKVNICSVTKICSSTFEFFKFMKHAT